ncbi:prepilin-type N-terminal cleavage/methylation domain-containing protein [Arenimonas sp.]|uniref:prepilin-type N-terminal cleavage/methylation domain-containing protein n=1 Tax=Arenimonas sp. TaxID=1872635 RepID=UPI0035AF6622
MRRPARGFTLLELLVVLVLLGALAALVAPATVRGIDAWRLRVAAQSLEQQVARLPLQARAAGVTLTLGGELAWPDAVPAIELEDARVQWLAPLVVRSNGFCEAGALRLLHDEARRDYDVLSPDCRLRRRDETEEAADGAP